MLDVLSVLKAVFCTGCSFYFSLRHGNSVDHSANIHFLVSPPIELPGGRCSESYQHHKQVWGVVDFIFGQVD